MAIPRARICAGGAGQPASLPQLFLFIVCFLLESDEDKHASEWSRDGKYLLYACQGKDTRWDLWALPMSGEKKPFPVAKTRFAEMFGGFSPDGRYATYSTDESGQQEVYVQDFPEARNKWQVSTKAAASRSGARAARRSSTVPPTPA